MASRPRAFANCHCGGLRGHHHCRRRRVRRREREQASQVAAWLDTDLAFGERTYRLSVQNASNAPVYQLYAGIWVATTEDDPRAGDADAFWFDVVPTASTQRQIGNARPSDS